VQEAARRKGDADWRNVQLSKDQKDAIDKVSQAYADQAEALRQAQEGQELRADVLRTGFDGIRNALEDGKITLKEWGDIGISVLDRFIDKIEDDLVNALSQLGGAGGGGGGILGSILGLFGGGMFPGGFGFASPGGFAAMLGLASGGEVRGPGTSTSDSIPTMLSDGEFVVKAEAAKKNRGILEAINSGASWLSRASGGPVPGSLPTAPQATAIPFGGEAGGFGEVLK
jgi:hypothetical protein